MKAFSDGTVTIYNKIDGEDLEEIKSSIKLLEGKIVRFQFMNEVQCDVKLVKFKFNVLGKRFWFEGDTCGIDSYVTDLAINQDEIEECHINNKDNTVYFVLKSKLKIFITCLDK